MITYVYSVKFYDDLYYRVQVQCFFWAAESVLYLMTIPGFFSLAALYSQHVSIIANKTEESVENTYLSTNWQ